MAIPDVLHDLVDDQELLAEGAEDAAREVMAEADLDRLMDPNDADADADLRDALLDRLVDFMERGHELGRVAAGRVVGRPPTGEHGEGPILDSVVVLFVAELERAVVQLGRAVDAFVVSGRARGMSKSRIGESLHRAFRVAVGEAGVIPLGSPAVNGALRELVTAIPKRATSSAVRAGMMEVYGGVA